MKNQSVILVADDEIMNLIMMEKTLRSFGYKVLRAANGLEAIESANKNHPDLILLDIVMPEMNGLTQHGI